MAKSKCLVVFYSRTGTTRKLAQAIAQRVAGETEEITEPTDRAGIIGFIRSIIDAARRSSPPIDPAKRDPSAYELVVIGTPVWAGSVSSPVRSYLVANRARLRNVAFFCTLGGRGGEGAFTQMQELAGKAPRARCAVSANDVASGNYERYLADFTRALAPSTAPATNAGSR